MAFPPSFLDEIRNRLTCSSVVGRRVRLAKKGREFSGLCPFHNEKSPSFFVNDDKGFFHCFGCGAHGDVIGFQMRIDNMGFPEAVEKLAEEAGLEVPRSTPVDAAREERRKTLADVVEAAAAWFEQQLWSGAGRVGLDYFRRRGLSDETIRAFRLGYAPDGRDALKQALKKQGFEETMMLEAALLSKPEDGRDCFDFFRGRVMFPITERRGRVIAFGGRILGDGQPKYLNSRDTPLFDKGRNLYAFDKARVGVRDGAEAIVAEGYMDVIALHAAGFRGAVAPLGTALTEGQLDLAWRLAPEPIICLDGDAAGQRAARRAAERALPLLKPGHSLRFATMPPGEDPDTLLQSRGRVAVEELLKAARPLVDLIWSTTLEAHTTDTPERRAGFQADLERQVAEIADGAVQELYRQEMRRRMWALLRPESPARRRQGKWTPGRRNSRDTGHASTAQMSGPLPSPSPGRNIHFLLATVIAFPNVLEQDCEIFARIEIADPTLEQLRRAILEAHDANPSLDREHLSLHLNNAGFEGIVARLLGSSIFKGLAFIRTDDGQAAAENWQKMLLELHKRGAQDELRRAGDVSDAGLTELWNQKIEEMQRELVRAQALELEDESPIIEPITPRAGRGPR